MRIGPVEALLEQAIIEDMFDSLDMTKTRLFLDKAYDLTIVVENKKRRAVRARF